MTKDKFAHLDFLPIVAGSDLQFINKKDRQYGASWKKRGGVSAFMMLSRKWDRIEEFMGSSGYDIFKYIALESGHQQGTDGTMLAEVRDLRRYLMLVEAEAISQGWAEPDTSPDKIDLYDALAVQWGVSRKEAKSRAYKTVYGPSMTAPAPAPAQSHMKFDGPISKDDRVRSKLTGQEGRVVAAYLEAHSVSVLWDGQSAPSVGVDPGTLILVAPPSGFLQTAAEPSELSPAADNPAPATTAPPPAPSAPTGFKTGADLVGRQVKMGGYAADEHGTIEGFSSPMYSVHIDNGDTLLMDREEFELEEDGEQTEASDKVNDRVVPNPSPVLELEHQRQPRDATNAEYQAIKSMAIPAGTEKGMPWSYLYFSAPADDGRWKMQAEYQEEYGS